jgi:hypothetical protein
VLHPILQREARDIAAFYTYSGCTPETERTPSGGLKARIVGPEGEVSQRLFEDWINDIVIDRRVPRDLQYPPGIWRDAVAEEMALIKAGK